MSLSFIFFVLYMKSLETLLPDSLTLKVGVFFSFKLAGKKNDKASQSLGSRQEVIRQSFDSRQAAIKYFVVACAVFYGPVFYFS